LRYENVAIAGMNYTTFVNANAHLATMPPFRKNVHVYSCCFIRNDLPMRWRGRYNEDTDLCLQVLANNWCTILVNTFCINKAPTLTMKGGNMEELYRGDGRLRMAKSLERQWPYISITRRRYNRPQHSIKNQWTRFDTPLIRRKDIDWSQFDGQDDYGLDLQTIKPIRSKQLLEYSKKINT